MTGAGAPIVEELCHRDGSSRIGVVVEMRPCFRRDRVVLWARTVAEVNPILDAFGRFLGL
jgi:hypothetical protein